MITREEFIEKLRLAEDGIPVEFMKVDGTVKQITMTLHPNRLPKQIEENPNPFKNDRVVVFWDVDENRFKSFVWERFIRIIE